MINKSGKDYEKLFKLLCPQVDGNAALVPRPTLTNFNCNRPPFLIKIKRRAKKYFCANSKASEVVKNRFCVKFHTHEIKVDFSNCLLYEVEWWRTSNTKPKDINAKPRGMIPRPHLHIKRMPLPICHTKSKGSN